MIRYLEHVGYTRVVEVSCETPGCGVVVTNRLSKSVGNSKYIQGYNPFLASLRLKGWSIGNHSFCPDCNSKKVQFVECSFCHTKRSSTNYSKINRAITERQFFENLRKDGWIVGKKKDANTCPKCVSNHLSNIRTLRITVDENLVAEINLLNYAPIILEVFNEEDCNHPISNATIQVGIRGGIYLQRTPITR